MNRFYVITNHWKDSNDEVTSRIQKQLLQHGKECILAETNDTNIVVESIPENIDCAIVVGGDGTFIKAARALVSHKVPILGVNMGTLGYLTEVEVHNVEGAIDQLLSGDYTVEERMMLKGILPNGEESLALNDVVVSRSYTLRIVRFDLFVNGEFLYSYQADGIILSTPTGSTSYNLSAGGPIVEPTAAMLLVTPICSHALNQGCIVLSKEDVVEIEIGYKRDGSVEDAVVSFDGNYLTEVKTTQRVTIKKAKETTKIIKLSRISFLETLRDKMKGN